MILRVSQKAEVVRSANSIARAKSKIRGQGSDAGPEQLSTNKGLVISELALLNDSFRNSE